MKDGLVFVSQLGSHQDLQICYLYEFMSTGPNNFWIWRKSLDKKLMLWLSNWFKISFSMKSPGTLINWKRWILCTTFEKTWKLFIFIHWNALLFSLIILWKLLCNPRFISRFYKSHLCLNFPHRLIWLVDVT